MGRVRGVRGVRGRANGKELETFHHTWSPSSRCILSLHRGIAPRQVRAVGTGRNTGSKYGVGRSSPRQGLRTGTRSGRSTYLLY